MVRFHNSMESIMLANGAQGNNKNGHLPNFDLERKAKKTLAKKDPRLAASVRRDYSCVSCGNVTKPKPTKSRINAECLVVTHSSDCTAKRPARVNSWCLKAPGLSSSQRKLCLRVPGLQTAIKKGIEKGLQECEREFQWNRWNCSLLDRKNLLRRAPGGLQ